MKSKVWTLRIAIILSFVSLIVAFVINFCFKENNTNNFILSIVSGIFSGTIVSVFIYIAEYNTEKRKVMENYYILANEYMNHYLNLKCYTKTQEDNILLGYNNYKLYHNSELCDKTSEYENTISFYNLDAACYKENINYLDKKLEYFYAEIDEVLDRYLVFDTIKFIDIDTARADMYFFWNQKYRDKIYGNIHIPLREMFYQVHTVCQHIKLYKKGKSDNLFAVLDIINELQKNIFKTDIVDNEDECYSKIYNIYCDNLYSELEKFRAKMYGFKPRIVDRHAVEFHFKKKRL